MEGITNKSRCMASLAVFRQLYNEKKDIYSIIAEFIKQIISHKNYRQFELSEMVTNLSDLYGFDIPFAVVKSASDRLKFLRKENNLYYITDSVDQSNLEDIYKKQQEVTDKNQKILDKLYDFILPGQDVPSREKNLIRKAFYTYIIEETAPNNYSQKISEFLIFYRDDVAIMSQIKQIKEGVLLYLGLTYNSDINTIGNLKDDLYIFLETEILFHMAGYNGLLFQTLFNEFYSAVQDINKRSLIKNKKKIIHLRYFRETKEEIDNYFSQAERIVEHKEYLNISKVAMSSIVHGLSEKYQVSEKKTNFEQLLIEKDIKLDERYRDYYSRVNYKYNIEDTEFLKDCTDAEAKKISNSLQLLNYININRGKINKTEFASIKYILLSGNSMTLKLAKDPRIKQPYEVPLSESLFFFTNRFWFILNKGLTKNEKLKSFDIITKAQVILSDEINEAIEDKFTQIRSKLDSGDMDIEKAKLLTANLKQHVLLPEDISSIEDIDSTYTSIITDGLDEYIAGLELASQKEKQEKEDLKENLQQTIDAKNDLEQNQEKILHALQEKTNSERYKQYKKDLSSYKLKRNTYVHKAIKDAVSSKIYRILIWFIVAIVFFTLSLLNEFQIELVLWSKHIPSIILLSLSFFLPFFNKKSINEAIVFLYHYHQSIYNIKRTSLKDFTNNNKIPLFKATSVEELKHTYIPS